MTYLQMVSSPKFYFAQSPIVFLAISHKRKFDQVKGNSLLKMGWGLSTVRISLLFLQLVVQSSFFFFFFSAIIKTDVFFPGKKSCLYQSILITFLFLIIGHFAYKMASIIPDSVIMNRRNRLQRENVEKKLKMIKKKEKWSLLLFIQIKTIENLFYFWFCSHWWNYLFRILI